MAQHDIEVILMRELASHLAMAVFVVDPSGELVFYNEPAELLLGTRFDETGPMLMDDWSSVFEPSDEQGHRLEPERLPLVIAVEEGRPAHGRFFIRGLDGARRPDCPRSGMAVTSSCRRLGAAAVFWEATE